MQSWPEGAEGDDDEGDDDEGPRPPPCRRRCPVTPGADWSSAVAPVLLYFPNWQWMASLLTLGASCCSLCAPPDCSGCTGISSSYSGELLLLLSCRRLTQSELITGGRHNTTDSTCHCRHQDVFNTFHMELNTFRLLSVCSHEEQFILVLHYI